MVGEQFGGPESEDTRWSPDKAWDVAHAPEVKDRIDDAAEKGADDAAKQKAYIEEHEKYMADASSTNRTNIGDLRRVAGQSQALSDEANYQRNSLIEMEGEEYDAKAAKEPKN